MSERERIQQTLESLKQNWQLLSAKREAVEKQFLLETDAARRFQQKATLDETVAELTALETKIAATEQELATETNADQIKQLRDELATLRRNKVYPQELLQIALQLQVLTPHDPKINQEVSELQQRVEQGNLARQVFARLTAHFAALAPIITLLSQVLDPRNQHEQMTTIATIAQNFLDGHMQAPDFIQIFQSLLSSAAVNARTNNTHQYVKVAESISKGRTVLFLGSAIPHLYAGSNDDEQVLVSKLAEEIQYQSFSGSLSSIAEYYQLTPGFGRRSLLENLQKSLPQDMPALSLYASLAHIPTHLVIISAAYDTLLENAFRVAGKPFVEIASIIIPTDDYKLGYLVLKYSDRAGEERYTQEQLSQLELLKQYSILYKIRGTCGEGYTDNNTAWRDALTLSESNYFTFAENAGKIIPDYITRQFRDREFLFIGFSPARWEDRLLARALLLKRHNYPEPCYTIGKTDDPLQKAFWENQNVRQYEMDFAELDKHLQEANP